MHCLVTELPRGGNFQLRSKSNHVGKMSHGETRGFEARDPVWKGWSQSERMESTRQGHLGEAAEARGGQEAPWPWRAHADMGRWVQALLRARCCGMPMWPSPSQLIGFFPSSLVVLQPADPKSPGGLESTTSACSCEVTPRRCVTNNASGKQESSEITRGVWRLYKKQA